MTRITGMPSAHAALNLAAKGTVVVFAVFGVLDNLVMGQMILEISYRHEMVVDAVLLALTRGAGGGGDGVLDLRVFFSRLATTVSLPVPDGPETTNRYFSPFILYTPFQLSSS